jgi:hypothetical protein
MYSNEGGFNYAQAHNEGTDKLPKREFMGDSHPSGYATEEATANE